ncbi:aminodeoxychorismate synthase component I [Candidatus Puniceispirillum marinum]|uniref:Para-aminobenzoate synthase, component I n=1 Tax=Puniceispirillum marinum (strain IMCC1322) TaxID=488538 RepID=D5BPJ2_PUNMI|nr:aminodeoxychorismate synthase component I [Candidatus Puniceispirillum marinum]ADE38474.1 para-aminobenzoate synthase, component I [Candidatus Puniceispirillum marinum IMCC1322]
MMSSYLNTLRAPLPFVLLDANYHDDDISHLFRDPVEVVSVTGDCDITAAMAQLEQGLDNGLFAAGFISYEAAHQFDPALITAGAGDAEEVTICFGLFREHIELTRIEADSLMAAAAKGGEFHLSLPHSSRDIESYLDDIAVLQTHITAGDTYQTNYTYRMSGDMHGDRLALYEEMRQQQPVSYGAFVQLPDVPVYLSRSPELFFRKNGNRLVTRPMKGTAPRGANDAADHDIVHAMLEDGKTQSENTIIVDLLRNDFGRVAVTNSVSVDAYLSPERYKSVHQLTSTISCEVPADLSISDLFAGVFPCGSVTGAPKVRTMQIISDLEKDKRGIYTGSIGYILPNRDMCFNVAIRTLSVSVDGYAEVGVGGGIVHESDGDSEFAECAAKMAFLERVMIASKPETHLSPLAKLQAS